MSQNSNYAAPGNDEERASVERVESLLTLIQEWPAEEPPVDLVSRTMARIASSTSHTGAHDHESQQAAPRLHDPNGPVS